MIELPRNHQHPPTPFAIKILGLGGAGSNALDRVHLDGIEGAELIAINTDVQSLTGSVAPTKVQLGRATTRGLGAGGDPEVGYAAADESADEIRAAIEGASLVFLCTGLGGGTGSGAAPIIASIAREQGAMTVVFATLPFSFEGKRRMAQAEEALGTLQHFADAVICFENDRMADAVSPRAAIHEAFAAADQTISQSIRAVSALVQRRGLIQLGFDELATALRSQNARCLFAFGEADGDNRAHAALERALKSPLMDRGRLLADAQNVLVNVAGGPDMTLNEVQILMEEFNRHINESTRILFGTAVDPRLAKKMSVTILTSVGAEVSARIAPLPVEPRVEAPPSESIAAQHAPDLSETTARIAYVDSDEEFEPVPEPPAPVRHAPPAQPPRMLEPVGSASRMSLSARVTPKPAASEATAPTKIKHEQMQFEPVTRGRFEKSEPTIIDGQDLDVPTFLRRNMRPK